MHDPIGLPAINYIVMVYTLQSFVLYLILVLQMQNDSLVLIWGI